MMEFMKKATIDMIRNKWMKAEDRTINIVKEISNLFNKITIGCFFGSDYESLMVPQIRNGVKSEYLLGETVILQLEQSLKREYQPHLLFFSELIPYYISQFDKELAFNQDQLRGLIRKMIAERREAIKKDPQVGKRGDLLSVMLQDPVFENDDEQIINESLTFFIGGTLTQATTIGNTLCYMIKNPIVYKKVRESLSSNFKSFGDKTATLE